MRGALQGAYTLVLAVVVGCGSCDEQVMARVLVTSGEVERDHAGREGQWDPVSEGDAIGPAEAVRTRANASAKLGLQDGALLNLGPETLVRFLVVDVRNPRVRVATGMAELEAVRGDLSFETDFGVAVLSRGGRARVRRAKGRTEVAVLLGRAHIEASDKRRVLTAGESVVRGADDVSDPKPLLDGGSLDAQVEDAGEPTAEEATTVTLTVQRGLALARAPEVRRPARLRRGVHEVVPMAQVSLRRRTKATLARGDAQVHVSGPARFSVGQTPGPIVIVKGGKYVVAAGEEAAEVALPGGDLVALPSGGTARLELSPAGTHVAVTRGSVDVRSRRGEQRLAAGETIYLDRLGRLADVYRMPRYAEMTMDAGESVVIHDGSPPTAIRLRFKSPCRTGDARIEFARGRRARYRLRARGRSEALVRVGLGLHRYRLRCDGDDDVRGAFRGVIRVVRDPAVQKMAPSAPSNTIEADGRRYSVLYQNREPQIRLRWSRAPSAGAYRLHVDGGGKRRTFDAPLPERMFASGELSEGVHRFFFETAGGARLRSPLTTLRVAFDNASPAAYLRQRTLLRPDRGGRVYLSGGALQGARVRVGDQPLRIDSDGRFRGKVTPPAGDRGVGVRIAHPRRGVHYYVRRLAQQAPR